MGLIIHQLIFLLSILFREVTETYLKINFTEADAEKLLLVIQDSTERDRWTDRINGLKELVNDAFTTDKEEPDFLMTESEVKFMLPARTPSRTLVEE